MTNPASDLDALGIDSANLRWLAARDLIDELSAGASKQINALFLATEFLDLAEWNAIRRLAGHIDIAQWIEWGPTLIDRDYLEARSVILSRYKGLARERARTIVDEVSPPQLRKTEEPRESHR